MTRQPDDIDRAQIPALDHPASLSVAGVEPALEAQLEGHSGRFDELRDRDGLVQGGSQRLLAVGRDAAFHTRPDQVCMCVGGSGDDDRVHGVHEGVNRR